MTSLRHKLRAVRKLTRTWITGVLEWRTQKRYQIEWMAKRVTLLPGTKVINPNNVSMGEDITISHQCWIQASSRIAIGSRTMLGPRVMLITANHNLYTRETTTAPIVIEDEVWIGAGATILPGVTLRKGAVVAAGAVVTRDVEAYKVVGGVPAREIKTLDASRLNVTYFSRPSWKALF